MPWVCTKPLSSLIAAHVVALVDWLAPFISEFQRRRWRREIRYEPDSAKVLSVQDDAENISWKQFVLDLGESTVTESAPLRHACLTVAQDLRDFDMLDARDAWRLQVHRHVYEHAPHSHVCAIDVGALLDKRVFPDFVGQDVNPQATTAIRAHVLGRLLGAESSAAIPTLPLPNWVEQRRRAFESKAYRHATDRASQSLSRPPVKEQSAAELHALLTNRFVQVSDVLSHFAGPDMEYDRAKRPLPYFLEAPLISWERSPHSLVIQNGFVAFETLLKTVVLFALTELHQIRTVIADFSPPPNDVAAGIRTAPSLGHWSKCLDYLGRYAEALPLCGDWLRIASEFRARTISLIELRNSFTHATRALDRRFLDDIAGQQKEYLDNSARALRRAEVSVFLLLHRKVGRGGTTAHVGLDLCSVFDRFRDARIDLPSQVSAHLIDGEIVAKRGATVLSLHPFFRAQEVAVDQYSLFVYEKSFSGSFGRFAAVSSAERLDLKMAASPLDQV